MLEFKKNGEHIDIITNGETIGRIYKDDNKNYNFNHIVEFYFKIAGYNHTAAAKNWKRAKASAEQLYNNLMMIHTKYGKEITRKPPQ